jgi:uncharacterized protein YerC
MDNFENWLPLLLTKKELKDLQKRFSILKFLKTKLTYRKIAQEMKISTTTVVRLNQRLKIRKKRTSFKTKTRKALLADKKAKLPWKFG